MTFLGWGRSLNVLTKNTAWKFIDLVLILTLTMIRMKSLMIITQRLCAFIQGEKYRGIESNVEAFILSRI